MTTLWLLLLTATRPDADGDRWRIHESRVAALRFEVPEESQVFERTIYTDLSAPGTLRVHTFRVVPAGASETQSLGRPAYVEIGVHELASGQDPVAWLAARTASGPHVQPQPSRMVAGTPARVVRVRRDDGTYVLQASFVHAGRVFRVASGSSAYDRRAFARVLDSLAFTNAAENAPGVPALPSDEPVVRMVYLVPSDRTMQPGYREGIERSARHLQAFYRQQITSGQTFRLHDPVVEVVHTGHPASWYSTQHSSDSGFWNTALYDGFAALGGGFDDPSNRWIFYMDADQLCNQFVGGGSGVALMPANDLRGLACEGNLPPCAGDPPDDAGVCRWVGGAGHELGHAFLLAHPSRCPPPDTSCSRALMWTGYRVFPGAYLLASEVDQLLGPRTWQFFAHLDPGAPAHPCTGGCSTVDLAGAALEVGEGSGEATLGIRVTTISGNPTVEPVAVSYATTSGSAGADVDFTARTGEFSFPAGTPSGSTRSVAVPLIDDALDENDESFGFGLTEVSGAGGGLTAGNVTIVDDDPMPRISTSSIAVPESATAAVFDVALTAPSGRDVSVELTTADLGATAGRDYVAVAYTSPPLTIPAGAESIAVPVTILGDTLDEHDEAFAVRLGPAVNGTVLGSGEWRGTILDDDPPPVIAAQDRTLSTEGHSGSQPLSFELSLSAASSHEIQVRFGTEDITALAGADYTARDEMVVVPPETERLEVPVSITGDRVYEPGAAETFWVTLAEPVNATVAAPGRWRGSIVDDDPQPAISAGDCTRLEGNAGTVSCTFAVSLSNPSTETVRVSYATVSQTATSGADFEPAEGTLTFAPETSTRTVDVPLVGDVVPEINEMLLLGLSDPVNATLARGQGRGTIIDDEAMKFHPVPPCRVLDTRLGGPGAALRCDGSKRRVQIAGECGTVPITAKAAAVNVTAAQQTQGGHLRLYPSGLPEPGTSVLNLTASQARANNATVLLGTMGGATVHCSMPAPGGSTQVMVDVFGYYQ